MQMSLCRAEAKGKCFLWASASANTVPGLSSYLGTILLGVFFTNKAWNINFVHWCLECLIPLFKTTMLLSRTLENGCAICRRNRLLTCTASSTDRLQSPSFRCSCIQRGILFRLSARANLWTKINEIITTLTRRYH